MAGASSEICRGVSNDTETMTLQTKKEPENALLGARILSLEPLKTLDQEE
jgi:hypothetical protein